MSSTFLLMCLAILPSIANAADLQVLHSWVGDVQSGHYLNPKLVQGRDLALYGVTQRGGSYDGGTIFKINPDGSNYVILKSFVFVGSDGVDPQMRLIEGRDGALYGTKENYIFKINLDGSNFTILKSFDGTPSGLVEDNDGAILGTAIFGRKPTIVFKINSDGSHFTVLKRLSKDERFGNIYSNTAFLTNGSSGYFYGTTYRLTSDGTGELTIFKISSDGSDFKTIKIFKREDDFDLNFSGLEIMLVSNDEVLHGYVPTVRGYFKFKINTDGSNFAIFDDLVTSDLIESKDGFIYGVSSKDLIRMNRDGTDLTILTTVSLSMSGIIEGFDGSIYGTANIDNSIRLSAIFKLNKDGSNFAILKVFTDEDNGTFPRSGLTEGSDGALYGTTSRGGRNDSGTLFRLNKDGTYFTVLKSFTGEDGAYPEALIECDDGALYGTTRYGGSNYAGTIFKIDRRGYNFSVLKNFSSDDFDYYDTNPFPLLIINGSAGVLYGVTTSTIFRVNQDGSSFSLIKSFSEDDIPYLLVQGRDGALYGATRRRYDVLGGTLFKINQDGSNYLVLNTATSKLEFMYQSLLEGSDGALFGTISSRSRRERGTLFKIDPDGTNYKLLKRFSSELTGITEGPDGALYGAMTNFKNIGQSSLFKIDRNGSNFTSFPVSGGFPMNKSIKVIDGALYWTTYRGGEYGVGSVCRFQLNSTMSAAAELTTKEEIMAASHGSKKSDAVFVSPPTATPNRPVIGQTILFSANATDADGDTFTYSWDFGDGSCGTGSSTSHSYTVTGHYTVIVVAKNGTMSVANSISMMVASSDN